MPQFRREFNGIEMFLMLYDADKKTAEDFAKRHEEYRKKQGFRVGVKVLEYSGQYAVYSALMAPA